MSELGCIPLSQQASPGALLEMRNVEVVYDRVILVLRGVTLAVGEGEIVSLMGGNGAGKSTTLKAISNLLEIEEGRVTRGEITFAGLRIENTPAHRLVKRGVFQVMEGRRIFGEMTVRENLLLGAYTRADAEIAADLDRIYSFFPRLRERTGLAGYLSGGEQQMLAIGRALMAKPRLILLDEPSMGLSPKFVGEVLEIIQRINRELGIAVLLVEQNAEAALTIAKRGYVMENGKIVLEGTSEELRQNEDMKEFYLGGQSDGRSFASVKSYRRRKRWI